MAQPLATIRLPVAIRYGVALLAALLALAITNWLRPSIAPDIFTPLLAAVVVSAYIGGIGPGLFAALLASSGAALHEPPRFVGFAAIDQTLTLDAGTMLRTAVFMGMAMLVGTLSDRSRRAEARLAGSEKSATPLREDFLSIAAHELRTPLTSLMGQAQLLQRRLLRERIANERYLHSINVVVDQAERLNRTVTALLDIARLEQGLLTITRTPLDLTYLVQRVADELHPMLSAHTLTLDLHAGPLVVDGDVTRLRQTLFCLLDNAVKFSPAGGEVWVSVAAHENQAWVQVCDRGIGLPKESLLYLFECAYRAPNAVALQIVGAGLGLYLVKALVELHGGDVVAVQREGGGSCIGFRLPLITQETAR